MTIIEAEAELIKDVNAAKTVGEVEAAMDAYRRRVCIIGEQMAGKVLQSFDQALQIIEGRKA